MTHDVDFTVAIPTYNGENRLSQLLEELQKQIDTENFSWEIIVVDNNSTDNTAAVVKKYQASWQFIYPLKYYFESKQGAAYARQKAVEEAKGTFIGFLDDDNSPALNWVAAAYKFGQAHSKAGAYGSQIHSDFEVEPPDNFHKIACFLAITERGSQPHLYEPRMKMLPPSAGLVVRKKVWCENVPKTPFLSGRTTKSMLTSEDMEIGIHIQNSGWEIWYNPDMQIVHKISKHRLEKEYLVSLVRGIGLARHHIRMLRLAPWQRPLFFPFGIFNDLFKAILYFFKNHRDLKSDLVAACEMEFLLSSLISPFYICKKVFISWLNLP
ncbi:glycosyl transferase family protein [Fischerella sp. NIES-4106]|nr:glycosyl transferase family protein [Fischerella sp. NIES-4106]